MTEINDNIEPKSKSQKKRDMHALQVLGEQLVMLSSEQLAKFKLNELLLEAIYDAKQMTSNGAKRRQLQYIGKLMRSVEPEPIQTLLNQIHQQGRAEVAHFHKLEQWRDRLIAQGDTATAEFLALYPTVDRQQFRQLVRNAQQEFKAQKGHKYYKLLFGYIKDVFK